MNLSVLYKQGYYNFMIWRMHEIHSINIVYVYMYKCIDLHVKLIPLNLSCLN